MSLFKGKRNFWSQLLVSIVAFFALPQVAAVDTQSIQTQPQQPQTQQIQQRILAAVVESQTQILQPEDHQSAVNVIKVLKNEPQFSYSVLAEHAPIRAGPLV